LQANRKWVETAHEGASGPVPLASTVHFIL